MTVLQNFEKTVLSEVLPSRFAQRLCETLFSNHALTQYSHKQLQQIGEQLNQWQIIPSGTEGMRTAEVSVGGVNTDEVNPSTMASKKIQGLYLTGELLDINGYTGGYNITAAFVTGAVAGRHAAWNSF